MMSVMVVLDVSHVRTWVAAHFKFLWMGISLNYPRCKSSSGIKDLWCKMSLGKAMSSRGDVHANKSQRCEDFPQENGACKG